MEKDELIFSDLSYKITGLIFEIDNKIGYGQTEKVYGDAFEELLKVNNIGYEREVYFPIKIAEKLIKKEYLDFVIEDCLVIELKVSDHKYKRACSQLFQYLKNEWQEVGHYLQIY